MAVQLAAAPDRTPRYARIAAGERPKSLYGPPANEGLATTLKDESDEDVDRWFWSMDHDWRRLDDPVLVERIKSRFTERFLRETSLPGDRAPVIRRHLHVGTGADEFGEYVSCTFSLLGSTFLYYDDPSDLAAVDDWLDGEAESKAGDYAKDREYGFKDLEDGWEN